MPEEKGYGAEKQYLTCRYAKVSAVLRSDMFGYRSGSGLLNPRSYMVLNWGLETLDQWNQSENMVSSFLKEVSSNQTGGSKGWI